MTPTIGQMRKRIRIEVPQRVGDGIGGGFISWQLVDTVWAALEPLSGGEAVSAQRLAGSVSHEAWIRYRPGITPEMRLVFGIRRFDIRLVINHQERSRRLRLLLEERL